jgi:hypothetical protein
MIVALVTYRCTEEALLAVLDARRDGRFTSLGLCLLSAVDT